MKDLENARIGRRGFLKGAASAATVAATSQWLSPPQAAAAAPAFPVALRRCKKYDRTMIYDTMGQMFADLGGLSALVSGKKIAIKINGVGFGMYDHSTHSKFTHTTHPEVVYAACQHLLEAGAAQINIMESYQTTDTVAQQLVVLGFEGACSQAAFEALGNGSQVHFYSTRTKDTDVVEPGGWAGYAQVDPTTTGFGEGPAYMFDYFYFNKLWVAPKADIIVSIAKMKGHAVAGVTLSMKNLFGCPPPTIYGGSTPITLASGPDENITSARNNSCHQKLWTPVGEKTTHSILSEPSQRMPHLIADLNRALPIRLGIIDGITGLQAEMNAQAFTSITTPGVLAAGYNPVCLDAVCCGVMGCDPQSPAETGLFRNGLNHIALAAAKMMGSNDLSQIPVLGDQIQDVRYDYYPTLYDVGQ